MAADYKNSDAGFGFDDPDDLLWGFSEIGRYIRRSPSQASYLHQRGLLGDAVRRLSRKVTIGSKRRLRQAMARLPAAP